MLTIAGTNGSDIKVGKVYWITGLSGAGKTTIGTLLQQKLLARGRPAVLLDGDMLREAFGYDLGYSLEDRRINAMRYAQLCRLLSSQGIDVVCSTISLFHDIHAWNRENMPNYLEIYLKVSLDVLVKRNQKGLYDERSGITEVYGLNLKVEEPLHPDITIDNDGILSVDQIVTQVVNMGMR